MTMQMYVNEKCKETKMETLAISICSFADLASPVEIAKRLNVSLEFVQQVLNDKVQEQI